MKRFIVAVLVALILACPAQAQAVDTLSSFESLINGTIVPDAGGAITSTTVNAGFSQLVPVFEEICAWDDDGSCILQSAKMNVSPAASANDTRIASTGWIKQFFFGLTKNVQGTTGIAGLDGAPFMMWYTPRSTSATNYNVDTLRLDHHPNYSGGTGIASAVHAGCSTTAGQLSIEWCGQFTLDNFAASGPGGNGNNAGIFVQAVKEAGSGETWAQVIEAHDPTSAPNPTTALLGTEIGVFGHGTDSASNRIIANFAFGRLNQSDTAVAHVGHGLWFTPTNNDLTYSMLDEMIGGVGKIGVGLNMSKFTFTGPAISLTGGQVMAFDTDPVSGNYARYLYQSSGTLTWHSPTGNVFTVDDSGNASAVGSVAASGYRANLYTPPSSSSRCTKGQFSDDTNYHYVCTATNTWKRVALTTF